MEIITEQLQYQILQNYQSYNSLILLYLKKLLSCIGLTIVFCLECSIGFHIGGIVGWITGWCIALIHREYCELTHYISLDFGNRLYYLPYDYAIYGMVAGAVLGVFVILFIMLLKQSRKEESGYQRKEDKQ